MLLEALTAFNLLFAGVLAGVEIAVHYGFRGPIEALEEQPQIRLRQHAVRRLRVLVPAIFAPMALSGIALTAIDDAGRPFRLVGLIAVALWILIRVVGTIRINKATLAWDPAAPPADWREQLSRVERFHVFGTWAALIAFASLLAAAL